MKETGQTLVIAEKPSVAQSIAKVLRANQHREGYWDGNGYLVSWCLGHLVELAEPEAYDSRYKRWSKDDLPIVPVDWQYNVSAATKKQFDVLKELMHRPGVERLICATDAGREGELIFRLVYHQCECTKPFDRLWISSMEDSAIREGFANLRPGSDYDDLYKAALCRERADWLVGMNATRLISVLYGRTLHVGRVISPALAMAVLREAEIAAFQPEVFYTVALQLPEVNAVSERMKARNDAESIAQSCAGGNAVVTKCERKEKNEKPPALYDLTSLQREANRKLGYTAQQTLDYMQSLYEKKLVTYPRTDSRYLTDDMEPKVPGLVEVAAVLTGLTAPGNCAVKPLINSKKVTDHHAILPTMSAAKTELAVLPAGEREILRLIATRLLAAVAPSYRYAETVAEFQCSGTVFTAKGRTVLDAGWRAIEQTDKAGKPDPPLPQMQVGDTFPVLAAQVKEGKTKPKAHYTEDTLLSAMERAGAAEMPDEAERKGIGTPATRAGIIERLVTRGFLERKGGKKARNLIPTEKGTALITVLPEQLQSPSMTADWEEKLLKVERGAYAPDAFLAEIVQMIQDLVDNYQVVQDAAVILPDTKKALGICPLCGGDVVERPKSYSCVNRACPFALWKNNRYFDAIGKKMNERVARQLLKNGSIRMKDCYSQRLNRHFDATVFMTFDEAGKVQFQMEKGGTI